MPSSERELDYLDDHDLQLVRDRLPDNVSCLYLKYPQTLLEAAKDAYKVPYPEGYIPEEVYVYFSETNGESSIALIDGKLEKYDVSNIPDDPSVIHVVIDGRAAYVQLDGRVALNRLGGVQLPAVLINPGELMIRSLINQFQGQNSK